MLEVSKEIGLDRVTVMAHKEQIQVIGDVDMLEVNIKDDGITIRNSALNEDFVEIKVTCPKVFYDTNERNITVEDMEYLVECIQDLLEEQGILVSVGELKLGSFEVNYNINDSKFYDVFELISRASIHENLKSFKVENKNGIQSVKVPKQRYHVKIYKKSEHLMERFKPIEEDCVVRFEVSTNVDREKALIFGNEVPTLNGLIERWDKVIEWYKNKIRLSIKNPVESYIKDMEQQCYEMLERGLKPSVVANTMIYRQDMVDMIVFDNAMKRYYKSIGNTKNVSKNIKSTHNRLKKLDEERYYQTVGNVTTLQELYELLNI